MSCKPEPSELVLGTSMEQALGYLRRPVLMLDMNGTFMFGVTVFMDASAKRMHVPAGE